SSRRRHTRSTRDWSSDVCSSDLFDEVLLSSDGETIRAGTPLVSGAKVVAEVVGVGKEPKIYVFKFKRRKNYRRKTGHRQKFTERSEERRVGKEGLYVWTAWQ